MRTSSTASAWVTESPASTQLGRRPWLFTALVLVLAVSPLPFGSARPWAVYGLALALGLMAVADGILRLRRPILEDSLTARRIWLPALPFLLATGWTAMQMLPEMPASVAHPLWLMAAEAGLTDGRGSISASPALGAEALYRLAVAALAFALAMRVAADRGLARRLIAAASLVAGAYSAYGIAVTVTGAETILWLERWSHAGSLSATFVSRNSHAVYAGLGLLCGVASFALYFSSAGRPDAGLQERLAAAIGRAGPYVAGLAVAMLCNLAALLLTQSRAGSISTAAGLIVLVGLLWARAPRRRGADLAAAGLALVVIAYAVAGGAGLFERLATEDIAANERFAVYQLTLDAIADRPWLGHGLAAFEDIFRLYRTPDIVLNWDRDHNSYLGMALELGIPAALLMILPFLLIAARCLRGVWERRRDVALPALGAAALVLIAANAVLDFSIEIPAVALNVAVILAAAYAQSWPTQPR